MIKKEYIAGLLADVVQDLRPGGDVDLESQYGESPYVTYGPNTLIRQDNIRHGLCHKTGIEPQSHQSAYTVDSRLDTDVPGQ
jgi:hypothetical protein